MRSILLIALFLGIIPSQQLSQGKSHSSIIRGTVIDLETRDTLISANVVLETLDNKYVKGEATDIAGNFVIKGIQPGYYRLKVSYVGYQKQTIGPFTLFADSVMTFLVQLDPYLGISAERAWEDIHRGKFQIFLWDGMPMYSKEQRELAQKYHFEIATTGCNPRRTSRYDSVMVHYLEEKNGKGWFEKFLMEWDKLK